MKFSANDYLHEEWAVMRDGGVITDPGKQNWTHARAEVARRILSTTFPDTDYVITHRWVSEWEEVES